MRHSTEAFSRQTMPLFLLLAICFFALPAKAKYSDGTGEPNDPYIIATAEDLCDIGNHREDSNKHFALVNNIDLLGYSTQYKIIGISSSKFTGVFDGRDHKILNFKWTSDDRYSKGLFGYVGIGGQIKNLGLENANVTVGNDTPYVGGLAGFNQGTITNCYCKGDVTSSNDYAGGLVGINHGTLTGCYSTGIVSGDNYVGGLAGENSSYGFIIEDCYFSGTVTSTQYSIIGGLVGRSYAPIKNCYSTGNVSGSGGGIGGLVGENYAGITSCYSAEGNITGSRYLGGLVGTNWGTIADCCSTDSILGNNYIGGLVGINHGTITKCCSSGNPTGTIDQVGGLVGYNDRSGIITDCYSTGNVSRDDTIGGLVGYNNYGKITNCYSTGGVSGVNSVGGLVGSNYRGTITNCYSTGIVTATDGVGGLAGGNSEGSITNSYSTGSVSGSNYVGGLIGGNSGTITNCYSKSSVSGLLDYVGGLVGHDSDGFYEKSFWDINLNEDINGIGDRNEPNVMGKTTGEMQTKSTFTNAGWDFVGETVNGTEDIWRMCVDGIEYPKLYWQFIKADFLCPDGADFFDYSFFAERWAHENCAASNNCEGRDLDQLGSVDINDLRIFVDNWLAGF